MKIIAGFLTMIFMMAAAVSAQGVVVIANGGSAEITKADLEQCFLGKKTSWGSSKVTIAVLKDGETHESFMNDYIGKKPDQFLMYWKQLVFTGRGTMPQSFATDEELIAYVTKTPGAIGYVSSAAKDKITGSVKQVTIK